MIVGVIIYLLIGFLMAFYHISATQKTNPSYFKSKVDVIKFCGLITIIFMSVLWPLSFDMLLTIKKYEVYKGAILNDEQKTK